MPDAADVQALTQDIIDAAQKPASATIDGNSVNQQPLADKIAAANYVASQNAARTAKRGLFITQLVPGGCG